MNINAPRHAHELTFSCYRGYPFLKAERTCRWLAESIDAARREHDFALWAYVFMPNHAHLIVWPRQTDYDIASIRRAIKWPVARQAIAYLAEHAPQWLPRITRTRGEKTERVFWQSGGGYDRNVTTSQALMEMIDYVHANPVRKKLVASPSDWIWSSAKHFHGGGTVPLAVNPIPREWLEEANG